MNEPMSFYIRVVQALDEINAPYMLVGAFAGLPFGITRTTADIDILVDLKEENIDALANLFPLPRYYADPEMMRSSMAMGIMFNIIDSSLGVKADLVPLKREPRYQAAFDRRIRRRFVFGDTTFDVWCAQPSDIIIGKLEAWTEGRSSKHPNDIFEMLTFELSGLSSRQIDQQAIEIAASRLGLETLKLWKDLVIRAEQTAQSS